MIVLRSAVFGVIYFASVAVICLFGIVAARGSPDLALGLGRLWARIALWAARRLCGIELRVSGREHLPVAGAALIASQHQSAYDTLIWFMLVPRPAYVLKRQLAEVPLFGRLALVAGMIAVDREGGAGAIRALIRAAARAAAEQRQVIIFPEGTRTAPGERVTLQPGIAAMANRTGLPVIPVRTDSGRCWGRRRFVKYPGTIHVEILPPLPAGLSRGPLMAALEVALGNGDDARRTA